MPPPPGPLDLVVTETPPNGRRFVAPEGGSRVLRIGPEVRARGGARRVHRPRHAVGRGRATLRDVHAELTAQRAEGLERSSITHILQALIDRGHPVVAVDIHKGWMEIDSFDDYRRAWAEVTR